MKRRTSRIQPPGRLAIVLLAALIALPATPRVAKAEGLRAADADGTHATQADSPRAEWQLLAGPVDPPPMYGHVALHDPVRHRMVFVNGARAGELWCLSLPADGHPAWSRQPIGGPEYPGSRYNFAAVYDSAGDRVIVFGGYRTWLVDYDDVWALTLGDAPRWTRIVTSGDGPHSRAGCAAAFDPVRRRLVIFGGYAYSGGQLGDTWALELAGTPAWHRLAAGGRSPLHREGAKAVYDPWNDRMVLFGGWVDGDYSAYPPPYYISDETWALPLANPASWDSLVIPVRPSPRQTFLAAVDREHRVMLVSGGEGWQDGHERADTWALRLDGTPAWSQVSAGGSGPGPVSWHAGDYSPERASLIQYGGIWTAVQSQCFELALDTDQWSQVLPEGPDPAPDHRPGRGH